ncbi:DNA-binding transcriptional LysR family regulator [Aliiruegeria haliotis]|uniref:DNA-binding transcriptional LysR family regulator n=1 Tax=Aliiruegeria haliotis TaxID=1280846 RepID=A0A2T0RZ68_9RHOB|nr:LysR family transcriptional regulator [Aliiruegeria haliotis]PRY26432.1 DNA-binding transcriptional LysR family regulator [Aliiruegeria haliotis]
MLNAHWLETFVAVCEHRNLTRTAERLNMTQPGVSQHLKKLEAQVGTALLRRTGKSFTLTPAGERLRAFAIARQQDEKRLLEEMFDDDPDIGAVSIACSGSIATCLYPELVSFAKPRPGLAMQLEAAPQPVILQGVSDGRFDLGIVSEVPSPTRVEATHIGREEICIVLPADWVGGAPAFSDLEARGFISHPDGTGLADLLLGPNYPDEYPGADRLRIRSRINQIGQILAPVAEGVGYTVLPRSGLGTFNDPDRIRSVRLPVPVFQDLWLIRRKNRQLASRTVPLIEIIMEIARSLSGPE